MPWHKVQHNMQHATHNTRPLYSPYNFFTSGGMGQGQGQGQGSNSAFNQGPPGQQVRTICNHSSFHFTLSYSISFSLFPLYSFPSYPIESYINHIHRGVWLYFVFYISFNFDVLTYYCFDWNVGSGSGPRSIERTRRRTSTYFRLIRMNLL